MIYFSLAPHIYATYNDNQVVLLDSAHDKYLSLIDAAAYYLQLITESSFTHNDQKKYVPVQEACECSIEHLNYWITYFIEKQIIIESAAATRKHIAPEPLVVGGLHDYKWDHKPSWQPFRQTSKLEVLKALFTLTRVHYLLKRKGIQGILNEIKKASTQNAVRHQPTNDQIKKLANIIDAATILYPQKTFCLAWASTFVLTALRHNWHVNLVIGIQTNPFYAHAWAESAGSVINDDPIITQVLSIILRQP